MQEYDTDHGTKSDKEVAKGHPKPKFLNLVKVSS